MIFSKIAPLPTHRYVLVDSNFTHKTPRGFVEAMWVGVTSIPGRAWGINIILRDGGALYRNLPPHSIGFHSEDFGWTIQQAQLWDCYSYHFTIVQSPILRGLRMRAKVKGELLTGEYLFHVTHVDDGWSDSPDQDKEFYFIKLDNGRLTIQPTNRIAFIDDSFIVNDKLPELKLSDTIYSCE
jgi:hypothetical protein